MVCPADPCLGSDRSHGLRRDGAGSPLPRSEDWEWSVIGVQPAFYWSALALLSAWRAIALVKSFIHPDRAGKKCRLVDNIGARPGSEANFRSNKIYISRYEINCIHGKIWINMKETYKLVTRNASGKTQELVAQLIQHDGG